MSGGLDVLGLKEDDVTKMLAATTHLGAENVNFQMEQYVYKRNSRGKSSFYNFVLLIYTLFILIILIIFRIEHFQLEQNMGEIVVSS